MDAYIHCKTNKKKSSASLGEENAEKFAIESFIISNLVVGSP